MGICTPDHTQQKLLISKIPVRPNHRHTDRQLRNDQRARVVGNGYRRQTLPIHELVQIHGDEHMRNHD
jgi:hypothetical protein